MKLSEIASTKIKIPDWSKKYDRLPEHLRNWRNVFFGLLVMGVLILVVIGWMISEDRSRETWYSIGIPMLIGLFLLNCFFWDIYHDCTRHKP
ncbi:MAG: hypothetical protein V4697_02400 [Patescibacteria group bacterium]